MRCSCGGASATSLRHLSGDPRNRKRHGLVKKERMNYALGRELRQGAVHTKTCIYTLLL